MSTRKKVLGALQSSYAQQQSLYDSGWAQAQGYQQKALDTANTNLASSVQAINDNYGLAFDTYQPYINMLQPALDSYEKQVNSPQDFNSDFEAYQKSPVYTYALQSGQDAMQKSAAAKGMLHSGKTLDALDTSAQDYASQQYNNWSNTNYQRALDNVNIATQGQQSLANLYANKGNALSSTYATFTPLQQQPNYNLAEGVSNYSTNKANAAAQYTMATLPYIK